jgi:hypothetical protein
MGFLVILSTMDGREQGYMDVLKIIPDKGNSQERPMRCKLYEDGFKTTFWIKRRDQLEGITRYCW